MSNSITYRLRGALLASSAILAIPAAAFAQDGRERPVDTFELPHNDGSIADS